MNSGFQRQTAKIFKFPAGGRAALGGQRNEAKSAASSNSYKVSEVAYAGAWYHEAANSRHGPEPQGVILLFMLQTRLEILDLI